MIKQEDVGCFKRDELIIAQHKLDDIDITNNDQLIQFITEFFEFLEERIYTTDEHIEFENYEALMDAIIYHQNQKKTYIDLICKKLPNCDVYIAKDNNIGLNFNENASHSVSIISELLNIDSRQIDNSMASVGLYTIIL